MTEINKYIALKEKLQGVCDENNLVFSIRNNSYPFRLIIRPASGMDTQLDMLEALEDGSDTGYISPDASLVFAYRDGEITYKISETWTISESLFNKLKNLCKKMSAFWMAYFFREVSKYGNLPQLREMTIATAPEQVEGDDEDDGSEFEEFLDDEADEADDDRPGSGLYDEN